VLGPDAYDRMAANTDPLSVSNFELSQYADNYFQYDDQNRVTGEIVRGGALSYAFEYHESPNANDSPNDWHRRTIETRPDGSLNRVYTNRIGQVLLREFRDGNDRWITVNRYNDQFDKISHAHPSAVATYDESANDLSVVLHADQGLIERTEYSHKTVPTEKSPATGPPNRSSTAVLEPRSGSANTVTRLTRYWA